MENSEIQSLLESALEQANVKVEGDGYHYQIVVVTDAFAGLNKVKRTQMIYKILNEHIQSGALHAISVKPFTMQEWEQQNG